MFFLTRGQWKTTCASSQENLEIKLAHPPRRNKKDNKHILTGGQKTLVNYHRKTKKDNVHILTEGQRHPHRRTKKDTLHILTQGQRNTTGTSPKEDQKYKLHILTEGQRKNTCTCSQEDKERQFVHPHIRTNKDISNFQKNGKLNNLLILRGQLAHSHIFHILIEGQNKKLSHPQRRKKGTHSSNPHMRTE